MRFFLFYQVPSKEFSKKTSESESIQLIRNWIILF